MRKMGTAGAAAPKGGAGRGPKRDRILAAAAFLLAALLLLGSTVEGARAALTYYSETYASRVQMYDIGVTLLENGEAVSWRNYGSGADGSWEAHTGELLTKMLGEGESLEPGRSYPEELSVENSGTINQYVRVNVYKYWLDENGEKTQELSPGLIDLHFLCDETGSDNGWLLDGAAQTEERTVLYYRNLLHAQGEEGRGGASRTPAFTDTLTIDGSVAEAVSQTKESYEGEDGRTYTKITTTYRYDGKRFRIEAEVDAVQEHNAQDAAWSAWGRRVEISGEQLSLS